MIKHLILSIVFITGIYSCNNGTKDNNPTLSYEKYFDLSTYLDSLITSEDTIRTVSKTIRLNDLSEVKQIENYNIKNDLLEFSKKSIAHPKFIGKYKIDEKKAVDNTFKKTYTAIDPKLTIKKLTIERNQQQMILSIEILEQKETAIIKQDMKYLIEPRIGYSMMACDSLAIMGKKCKGYDVKYL